MTDKQKLAATLAELGIGFKDAGEGKGLTCEVADSTNKGDGDEIPDTSRITGYPGFFAVFEFDEDGKFIEMVIGE